MKIKLLRDQNVPMPAGTEVDVKDEARARWMISTGAAVVAEAPKPAKKPAKKTTKKD